MTAKAGVFISVIGDKLDLRNVQTAQKMLGELEATAIKSGAGTAGALNKVEQAAQSAGTKGAAGASRFAQLTGGAFLILDQQLANFGIPFSNAVGHVGEKLHDVEGEATGTFQRMSNAGQGVFLGLAVAAVAVGYESIHMADDFEVSHARLENAMHNAGLSMEEEQGRVDKVSDRMEQWGFTNLETESSLATLVRTTKNMDKATRDEALAADIARGRHISLEAATAILTKVEIGRVSMLGRLNIATKDSTGATISQEEALRRLTQLYGGDASQYSDTFAGKLQTLRAEAVDLGKDIGLFLIPILEDVVGTGADVFEFFDHNRTAAIALGVVVGGPLVLALGAFAATKAVDTAQALGTAMVRVANWLPGVALGAEAAAVAEGEQGAAALVATGGIEAENVALEEQMALLDANGAALDLQIAQLQLFSVAEGEAAVATEAAGVAGEAAGAGLLATAGAFAAGAAIVTVGVAAIMGGAYALGYFDDKVDTFARDGVKWADTMAKGIVQTHGTVEAYKLLHEQYDETGKSLQFMRDRQTGASAEAAKFRLELSQGDSAAIASRNNYDRLSAAHAELGKQVAALQPAYEKETAARKEANGELQATAAIYGVTIPASMKLTSAETKDMNKAIKASVDEFGVLGTGALIGAGMTGKAIQSVVKDAQTFATSLESSVDKFTDPFSHFSGAAQVSEQDLEKFFTDSTAQTNTWLGGLNRLMSEGVDQSFIQNIASIGPSSEPTLEAFQAMIDKNGIDVVNSNGSAMNQYVQATEAAENARVVSAAVHGSEYAQLVKAFTEDAKTGGSANMLGLLTSSDQNLRQMALTALEQAGVITGAVNSIPTRHDIDIMMNWQNFLDGAPDFVREAIPFLHRAMGGPIPGAPGSPVPVMAHAGEYVLSADVVDKIKRGAPSQGAQVAGGSATASDVSHATSGATVQHIRNYNVSATGSPVLVDEERLMDLFDRMEMLHGG